MTLDLRARPGDSGGAVTRSDARSPNEAREPEIVSGATGLLSQSARIASVMEVLVSTVGIKSLDVGRGRAVREKERFQFANNTA